MRYLILIVALFALNAQGIAAEIPEVSLIQLIATPDKFDGKRVMVVGVSEIEFEGNALYLHKEDRDLSLYKNALWLEVPKDKEALWKAHSSKYVLVVGTFRAGNLGHEDMFSGALEGIIRFEPIKRRSRS
jgi:hypothetical protein